MQSKPLVVGSTPISSKLMLVYLSGQSESLTSMLFLFQDIDKKRFQWF